MLRRIPKQSLTSQIGDNAQSVENLVVPQWTQGHGTNQVRNLDKVSADHSCSTLIRGTSMTSL